MKKKIILTAGPLLVITIPPFVYAEKVSLGVYPPIIRVKASSGAKISVPIAVINDSEVKQNLSIKLMPFQASSNNSGLISYIPVKNISKSDSSFLSTVIIQDEDKTINSIDIYPKDTKNLRIAFTAPASPQDHYFSVVFLDNAKSSSSEDTTISTFAGIATNVLVSVGNTSGSTGLITQFSAPSVVFNGPTHFNLTVTNNNSTYETISGKISIYDIFGNLAGQIPLKSTTLLANETRIIRAEDSTTGNTITWGENFLMGVYTAKAVVSFDKTNSATAQTHFIGIPFMILLFVSVILILILNIIFRALRKLNFKEA